MGSHSYNQDQEPKWSKSDRATILLACLIFAAIIVWEKWEEVLVWLQ